MQSNDKIKKCLISLHSWSFQDSCSLVKMPFYFSSRLFLFSLLFVQVLSQCFMGETFNNGRFYYLRFIKVGELNIFRCYRFVNTPMPYHRAWDWCDLVEYSLVSINNAFENAFLASRTIFWALNSFLNDENGFILSKNIRGLNSSWFGIWNYRCCIFKSKHDRKFLDRSGEMARRRMALAWRYSCFLSELG